MKKYINLLHDKLQQKDRFQQAIDLLASDIMKNILAKDLDCHVTNCSLAFEPKLPMGSQYEYSKYLL